MSKVRKKHNPIARLHRLYKSSLHRVWFAGGHCLPDFIVRDGIQGATPMQREDHMRYLLYVPHRWQILILAFNHDPSRPPGKDKWADTKIVPHTELSTHGGPVTADQLRPAAEKAITDNATGCNPKFLVSPGWWAVPTDTVDLAAMEQEIVEWFAGKGAFDADHCKLVWHLREGL